MFATRLNQENDIYEQQVAAAAKPLNQGVRGLAPKTPAHKQNAPKTPFRTGKNDENAVVANAKTVTKGGRLDKNTLVTPANPRTRAPLGAKTANTKAFQTPAVPPTQEQHSAKPSSPRLRRAKIRVHGAETQDVLNPESGEPEIEYMPPREVPLPDYPDDVWPHEREYPELQGENFTRGWWDVYATKRDDEEFSDWEEKLRKSKARAREHKERQARLQNVTSKSAAAALSSRPAAAATPGFQSSSAATRARQMPPVKKSLANERNPCFNAAKAASNSTIGYSKGRAVSSSARKPLSGVRAPESERKGSKISQQHGTNFSTLDHLLKSATADEPEADATLLAVEPLSLDDTLEDFKLKMPN